MSYSRAIDRNLEQKNAEDIQIKQVSSRIPF